MSRRLKSLLLPGTLVLVGCAGAAVAQNAAVPTKMQDRLPVRFEMAAAGPFVPAEPDGFGRHPAQEESRPVRLASFEAQNATPRVPTRGDRLAHAGTTPGMAFGMEPGMGFGPGFGPPPDMPDASDAGPGTDVPDLGPSDSAGPDRRGFAWVMPDRPFPGRPGSRPPDPLGFPGRLSAAETALGIRTDQLDAWRAFTDALQGAVMPPPASEPQGGQANAPAATPVSALVTRLNRAGEAGSRLAQAFAALKDKLRPDQVVRLAAIEPDLLGPGGPRRPPPPGPRPFPGPR